MTSARGEALRAHLETRAARDKLNRARVLNQEQAFADGRSKQRYYAP